MIQLSIDFVQVLSLVWSLIIYRTLKLLTCHSHILSQTGFQSFYVTHALLKMQLYGSSLRQKVHMHLVNWALRDVYPCPRQCFNDGCNYYLVIAPFCSHNHIFLWMPRFAWGLCSTCTKYFQSVCKWQSHQEWNNIKRTSRRLVEFNDCWVYTLFRWSLKLS